MHKKHFHYTLFTKTKAKHQKKVIRYLPPPRLELGFLQLESSTVPLQNSSDIIGRPVLVIFQGEVLHNPRDTKISGILH